MGKDDDHVQRIHYNQRTKSRGLNLKKLGSILLLLILSLPVISQEPNPPQTFISNDQKVFTLKESYSSLAGVPLSIVGLNQLSSIKRAVFETSLKDGISETSAIIPINLGSAQYRLSPGDKVSLFLWGESIDLSLIQNANFPVVQTLTVTSDGALLMPGVGRFDVRGLPLTETKEMIRTELIKKYKKFDLSLSLIQPRNQQVWVTGFVQKPGMKDVPPNASILDAVAQAEGPGEGGSMRNITVYRPSTDQTFQVDLYPILFGLKAEPLSLSDGDRIIVGSIGPTAALTGSVPRPGIYEFKGQPNLTELLEYAGGLGAFAADSAQVIQPTGSGFSISKIKSTEGKNFPSGTLVQILGVSTDLGLASVMGGYEKDFQVVVGGSVQSSGIFTMTGGARISDALLAAGGYGPNAFPSALILQRKSVKEAQIQQSEKIQIQLQVRKTELEKQLAQGKAAGLPAESLAAIAGNIAAADSYMVELSALQLDIYGGRVALSPPNSIAELEKDAEVNLILEPGDMVIIPQTPTHVLVMGNTLLQNSYPYLPGKRVRDYLEKAGGPNSTGDLSEVYLIKANGQVRGPRSSPPVLWIFRPNPLDELVGPGDTVVVPEKQVGDGAWMSLTREIISLVTSSINLGVSTLQLTNVLQ